MEIIFALYVSLLDLRVLETHTHSMPILLQIANKRYCQEPFTASKRENGKIIAFTATINL